MSHAAQKVVLLVNLGTPREPTVWAVREYLYAFLSDPRVVDLPAWLWKPLLLALILPVRCRRTARLYRSIWTAQGSPLALYSKKLAEKVQACLGDTFNVVLCMRYGQPSIQSVLQGLLKGGVMSSLAILPLYPQYSAVTTASCFDAIADVFRQQRFIPSLSMRFISSYFDSSRYITALAEAIRCYWLAHGMQAYLLFSFHGLPKRHGQLGDPYAQQCHVTVDLLAKELNLLPDRYQLVFQSRFGKSEWLQPYCEVVLRQLPARSIKHVAVICPGFAVDCLETLEEISQRYREIFLSAGGEHFYYIPALNASTAHSDLLASLIQCAIASR